MCQKWQTLYKELSTFDKYSTDWWTWRIKIDKLYTVFATSIWFAKLLYNPILSQKQHTFFVRLDNKKNISKQKITNKYIKILRKKEIKLLEKNHNSFKSEVL